MFSGCFQYPFRIGIGLTYKAVRSQISITSPMDGEVEGDVFEVRNADENRLSLRLVLLEKADVITRVARARYWTREERSRGQERQKAERRTANQADNAAIM